MRRILIITGTSVAFIALSLVHASAAQRQPHNTVVSKGKVLGKTKAKKPPTKVTKPTKTKATRKIHISYREPRWGHHRDRDRERWGHHRDRDRERFGHRRDRDRERFGHHRDRDRERFGRGEGNRKRLHRG
jgi:hypothetical protein